MRRNTLPTHIAKKGCIYKVHEQLREVNKNAYKPVLLAIGPYYDQRTVGEGFMKEHKLHYLQQIVGAEGSSEHQRYLGALGELEESARKCYVDQDISKNSNKFLEMMLLDGCFIIELFRKYEIYKKTRESPESETQDSTDEDDPIFQMKWVLPRIARDLLLFENQLPFFVLAKLFEMSQGKETLVPKGSRKLGERIVGSSVESSTSTGQSIPTSLNDLALGFFSDFLPFQWNVNASSYNPTEKIKYLLRLTHKALTPSLPVMVWKRLGVGFRFRNAKFEHLLGLIHASISISILDSEINHARECQEVGVKSQKVEIFKHLCGLIRKSDIPLLAKKAENLMSTSCVGPDIPLPAKMAENLMSTSCAGPDIPLLAKMENPVSTSCASPDNPLPAKMENLVSTSCADPDNPFSAIKMENLMSTSCAGPNFPLPAKMENLMSTSTSCVGPDIPLPAKVENLMSTSTSCVGPDIPLTAKMENLMSTSACASPDIVLLEDLSLTSKQLVDSVVCTSCEVHQTETESPTIISIWNARNLPSPKDNEGWESVPYYSELQEAQVELNMAKKFRDSLYNIRRWMKIPYAIELQEAGIELNKAEEFKNLHDQNRNESKEPCPEKELLEIGVEFNKVKKFKRLHAHREIEHWNIHGATELEEAGIKFKKAEKCNKFSIKFKNGLMEISPLSIEDHTETCLRNLIAYEQYCDGDDGFDFDFVTNYVCFMDYLINSPKDVELLRRKRIIRNFLGDDEVTSTMVNKLGHFITISTRNSMYARTSMEVNMHCSSLWNVSKAKLKRNYFNSPWALISFLAAVLLLLLAIVQTIFSIIH